MSMRRALGIASVMLACFAFAGWFSERPTWLDSTGGDATAVLMGSIAPDFKLKALSGKEVNLSGYRGQKTEDSGSVILGYLVRSLPPGDAFD